MVSGVPVKSTTSAPAGRVTVMALPKENALSRSEATQRPKPLSVQKKGAGQ